MHSLARYGIAITVAALVIGAAALYVRHVGRTIEDLKRQQLKAAQAAGQFPKDVDLDRADVGDVADFGMEVPEALMLQIGLADSIMTWRFILIPIVIVASLGIARMLKWDS